MSDDSLRTVRLDRASTMRFTATNIHGATLTVGESSETAFSPVELLLAAIGGCTALDVDSMTSRHAEPIEFSVTSNGHKLSDENGNRVTDLTVSFRVSFPEGAEGDVARVIFPRGVKLSHDKFCTVSRTVELGTPITPIIEPM